MYYYCFLLQNETDYQAFLKTSIELIAIIGDYSPVDTFNQVVRFSVYIFDCFVIMVVIIAVTALEKFIRITRYHTKKGKHS